MNSNLVAVQDFGGAAGATVMWKLRGGIYLHTLADAWATQGLPANWLPALPSAEQMLGRAVRSVSDMRLLARPISRRGAWAIVNEDVVGEDTLAHEQTLVARIRHESIDFDVRTAAGWTLRDRVAEAFAAQEGLLDRDDLAKWLVGVIRQMHGVPLRPRGAIYYLLPTQVETWRRVCDAIREAKAGECYTLPTLQSADATRAVLDALVDDVESEANDMADAIGSGKLKSRALRARVEDCNQLLERLAQYDGLLGNALSTVRARVSSVQDAALVAAFKVEAEALAEEQAAE